ncbi:MAG: hypothetical protein HYR73_01695 [Candidatus Eisenbacteria bacterium]|nr:hypothetical protein [Candidatus Eisenbacteria bacterium]
MQNVRNRLLILLALLSVGLFVARGEALATSAWTMDDGSSTPVISPYTGEPDVPGYKAPATSTKHLTQGAPMDERSPAIPGSLGFDWVVRIWAAMYLRAGF